MVSRAKRPGPLLKGEEAPLSLEHWIQKKGQSPWQPGHFKSESPVAAASEAYAKFCAEAKPSKCQRDAGAAWALWQACVDGGQLLAQRQEECTAWQTKSLELEFKCAQLQQEKQSLEEAWEAEKFRASLEPPPPLQPPERLPEGSEGQASVSEGQEALGRLQERCQQLEKEKAQWEAQKQELKAELGKMRQGLEVGQGRLASLLKANQEDRETCRSLQESYAQCQAEIERLRKETGAQQLQLRQAPTAAVAHRGPKEEEPEAAKRHRPGHGGRGTAWTGPVSGSCGPSGAAAAARPALELPLPAWAPSLQAPEEEAARSGGGEGGGEEKEGGGGGTAAPSGGPQQAQVGRRWKALPRWKRVCSSCGAWGRAERRGGVWDCSWCRAQAGPWGAPFTPRGGHYFPGRAAAVTFPVRGRGMQGPGRGWRAAPDPWRGPPKRDVAWKRREGPLASPGEWMCPQCHVSNYGHRTECFRCHSRREMDLAREGEATFQA